VRHLAPSTRGYLTILRGTSADLADVSPVATTDVGNDGGGALGHLDPRRERPVRVCLSLREDRHVQAHRDRLVGVVVGD